MKTAIIGGGITGLACGYQLSKHGIKVDIFESSKETGGIAGAIDYNGYTLEKYYHHFFKSDIYLVNLLKELGIYSELKFYKSAMGFYSGGRLYDFGTPMSLLKFKPLNFIDKIRFGLTILKLMRIEDYKPLEHITAHEWIIKNAGAKVYEKVWKPLLISKFENQYKDISMAWFWGKIKLRGSSKEKGKEALGYLAGSCKRLTERLKEEIIKNGGSIHTLCSVKNIKKQDKFTLETSGGNFEYDRVISTVPLPVFLKTAQEVLPGDYVMEKRQIRYTAVSCMILILDRPFTKYYWLNIGDESIPFGGLIEHTNLLNRGIYNGDNILYISNYLFPGSPCFNMEPRELLKTYIPHLKKINPDFDKSHVKDVMVFKDRYAQPIIRKRYSSIAPSMDTPVENLYTVSMCNIYPEDRGMNYAIRDGIKAADKIISGNQD